MLPRIQCIAFVISHIVASLASHCEGGGCDFEDTPAMLQLTSVALTSSDPDHADTGDTETGDNAVKESKCVEIVSDALLSEFLASLSVSDQLAFKQDPTMFFLEGSRSARKFEQEVYNLEVGKNLLDGLPANDTLALEIQTHIYQLQSQVADCLDKTLQFEGSADLLEVIQNLNPSTLSDSTAGQIIQKGVLTDLQDQKEFTFQFGPHSFSTKSGVKTSSQFKIGVEGDNIAVTVDPKSQFWSDTSHVIHFGAEATVRLAFAADGNSFQSLLNNFAAEWSLLAPLPELVGRFLATQPEVYVDMTKNVVDLLESTGPLDFDLFNLPMVGSMKISAGAGGKVGAALLWADRDGYKMNRQQANVKIGRSTAGDFRVGMHKDGHSFRVIFAIDAVSFDIMAWMPGYAPCHTWLEYAGGWNMPGYAAGGWKTSHFWCSTRPLFSPIDDSSQCKDSGGHWKRSVACIWDQASSSAVSQ